MFNFLYMEIYIFAKSTLLGKVNSRIVDDSMGVIGGLLEPSTAYYGDFQSFFRSCTAKADWRKLTQIELKAALETGEFLQCEGGICVDDVEGFDEIDVSFCGLNQRIMDTFRKQEEGESRAT